MPSKEEMLKGKDPFDEKETLSEKLRYFCSKYHFDPSTEEEDGYHKPTLKLFLHSCYRSLRGWTPVFKIRMFLQRVFRKNHISDNMLWSIDYPICRYALKLVKAFRKMERHGYPGIFSEYNENEWKSKEEYDKAIIDGRRLGGGEAAWDKILDHIIMALEFVDVDSKGLEEESKWYIKYFGMDPYDENNPVNKHVHYEYKEIDSPKHIGCAWSSKMPDMDKVEWCKKTTSYLNSELASYAAECVQYGFELFGKYLRNMWD